MISLPKLVRTPHNAQLQRSNCRCSWQCAGWRAPRRPARSRRDTVWHGLSSTIRTCLLQQRLHKRSAATKNHTRMFESVLADAHEHSVPAHSRQVRYRCPSTGQQHWHASTCLAVHCCSQTRLHVAKHTQRQQSSLMRLLVQASLKSRSDQVNKSPARCLADAQACGVHADAK
jgi:hypothetical protein